MLGSQLASKSYYSGQSATLYDLLDDLKRFDKPFVSGVLSFVEALLHENQRKGDNPNHFLQMDPKADFKVNFLRFKSQVLQWAEERSSEATRDVYTVWAIKNSYQSLLREAVERIEDMLKGDDGQAWKEAEKFVDKIKKRMPVYDSKKT